jgi:hypothetical protein
MKDLNRPKNNINAKFSPDGTQNEPFWRSELKAVLLWWKWYIFWFIIGFIIGFL